MNIMRETKFYEKFIFTQIYGWILIFIYRNLYYLYIHHAVTLIKRSYLSYISPMKKYDKCILKTYLKRNVTQKTQSCLPFSAEFARFLILDFGEILGLSCSALDEKQRRRYGFSKLNWQHHCDIFMEILQRNPTFCAHIPPSPVVPMQSPSCFFTSNFSMYFVRKFTLCIEHCFSKLVCFNETMMQIKR